MKTYTPDELANIIALHAKWLFGESDGARADLHDANLSGADLSDADLRYADLHGANLRDADLSDANLSGADLSDADLRGAKYRECEILRAPVRVLGSRHAVEEHWCGIRIGCEGNVTSDNLAQLFKKHGTPEAMRHLYVAAVKLIEDYAKAWPLLSSKKEDQ